tara:strand:- start:455 stop:691 length:237 start_codon:yes stop_codon:yes gene_type:complete
MKWKVSDDLTVLEMLVNKESVDVIANEIGATPQSLKMRIKNYQHIVKGGGLPNAAQASKDAIQLYDEAYGLESLKQVL